MGRSLKVFSANGFKHRPHEQTHSGFGKIKRLKNGLSATKPSNENLRQKPAGLLRFLLGGENLIFVYPTKSVMIHECIIEGRHWSADVALGHLLGDGDGYPADASVIGESPLS